MYGRDSWTVKKAEHRRIDAFELWCWRGLLRVPWTARRSNQSILKEISPEYSLEGLMLKLKLQYFGHLMWRTDSFPDGGKNWRWEEKGTTEDEMVRWHHRHDEMSLSRLQELVMDREATIFSLLQIWRNHHVHIGFAECGSMWVTELNWRANWYSNNSVTGKSHYYCCHFSRSNNLTNSVNHPLPTHICTALTAMNFPWTFNPNKDCTRSFCGLPFTSEETALARRLDSHLEKGGPDLGSEPRAVPCHCQASWDGHHTLTGSQCLDFP